MHRSLERIKEAVKGTEFETDLFLVGGAVRDELLGIEHDADFDLVTTHDSQRLARILASISSIPPVTYPRFGTAMVRVDDTSIELVTARRESYGLESRKPDVEPATLEEDAMRRDFTANALMRRLADDRLLDPTGKGLADLRNRILRTPLDPFATFSDDPLRMLRAVRFRWKLGFTPAEGLYEAVIACRDRLRIVSMERVRDELVKILAHPSAPDALNDLMSLGLIEHIVPEFLPMVDCEQGRYHHLDVWQHTLLVLRNAGYRDLTVSLAALLHDVGKPPTRTIDADGNTRFFGHEAVGREMSAQILRRLKFPQREVDIVAKLVGNHMRLGSSPVFTSSAARRLLRDMDGHVEQLLALVQADVNGLKPGVKAMDLEKIRSRLSEVQEQVPVNQLRSPLSGRQIMELTGLESGPEVGKIKAALTEMVIEGQLDHHDLEKAKQLVCRMTERT